MNVKLPYGLKDGRLVSIDDVECGLKCGCICPACKGPLIAKKGDLNEHHFAHCRCQDCNSGVETATHMIAKDLIANVGWIMTPAFFYPGTKAIVIEEKRVPIDKVLLESRLGSIIPDIIIESKGKILIVEITVSHGVDLIKENRIKKLNLPAIEVLAEQIIKKLYLTSKKLLLGQEFKNEVIEGVLSKRWINNPRANTLVEKIKSELKRNYCEQKEIKNIEFKYGSVFDDPDITYVDNCPLDKKTWKGGINKGKSFANVYLDCVRCPFNIDIEYDTLKLRRRKTDVPKKLFCAGYMDRDLTELIQRLR